MSHRRIGMAMRAVCAMALGLCVSRAQQVAPESPPKDEAPRAVPVEPDSAPAQEGVPKAEPVEGVAKPVAKIPVNEPDAGRPGTTVSRSHQFVIHGSGVAERGLLAVEAENVKRDLLRLLDAKDEWKTPIVIELFGDKGGPRPRRTVVSDLYVTDGGGFRLQLRVNLARGLDHDQFEHAVLAMLVYEWSLRGRKGAEVAGQRLLVRPWLVEGLREAIRWRTKKSNRRLYAALFETGGLFDLDAMLSLGERDYEKLDATARTAFRGSAGSLVLALLEQPDGRTAFRDFLGEVAVFDGEAAILLRKHFPGLNLSKKSLAKWWALQMANMAEAPLTEVLSVPETDKALAAALVLHVPDPSGMTTPKDITRAADILELPEGERAEAVRPAQDALVRLSYRCFPSFRSILADYQKILNELVEGKAKKLDERLGELASLRQEMVGKAADGRAYLDWFIITRAHAQSGDFDNYLELRRQLRRKPKHKNDPVSEYLDRMQEVFGR